MLEKDGGGGGGDLVSGGTEVGEVHFYKLRGSDQNRPRLANAFESQERFGRQP